MDNKQLLEELNELIGFGSKTLLEIRVDFKKIKSKKKLSYFMMGATQSYTQSIYKLLCPPHIYDKAAEIIFRSLLENLINHSWVYSRRDEKYTLIFAVQSFLAKIDFAKKYRNFMLKYPNWHLEFTPELKTVADWNAFIARQEKRIEKIEKRYKFTVPKKYPTLRERAIAHDSEFDKKGKLNPKTSLEFLYMNYYQYFSELAHLNSSGFDRFISGQTNELRLDIDAPIENITRVVSITYLFYFLFLKAFLIQFGIYKKHEFKRFNKLAKVLSKGNIKKSS